MLGTYIYTTDTFTWAGLLGRHMGLVRRPMGDALYIYLGGDNAQAIQMDHERHGGGSSLPPRL